MYQALQWTVRGDKYDPSEGESCELDPERSARRSCTGVTSRDGSEGVSQVVEESVQAGPEDLFTGDAVSGSVGRAEQAKIGGLLVELNRALGVLHTACSSFSDVLSEVHDADAQNSKSGTPVNTQALENKWLGVVRETMTAASAPNAGADVPKPLRVAAVTRLRESARSVDPVELVEMIRRHHAPLLEEEGGEDGEGGAATESDILSAPPSPSHVVAAALALVSGDTPVMSAAKAASLAQAVAGDHNPLDALRTGMAALDPDQLKDWQIKALSDLLKCPQLDPRLARKHGPSCEAVAEWLTAVAECCGAGMPVPQSVWDEAALSSVAGLAEVRQRYPDHAGYGAYPAVRSAVAHLARILTRTLECVAKPRGGKEEDLKRGLTMRKSPVRNA